jgi:alginate O-acetyltransferase complex protein AlgI
MIFNSLAFAIFLPVVFFLYWFVAKRNLKVQNILLLLASYFFYGWWDWRFLFLLIGLSLLNYFIGIQIDKDESGKTKGLWLALALLVNLGVLCVFKYYNFFIDSFIDLLSFFGYTLPRSTTQIILPLGISFYTFLSLSYILDIFKGNLKAHRNSMEVLLSLSFFPIILAGPIQRPSTLLPQIVKKREFDYSGATDGLKQIVWGLFVKTVIADNLAPSVDNIFKNYADFSGSTLLIGAILYAVQIYADFSGYSNIAIGTGKLFGFTLMQNFAYPYFARDISEFWKRWHMSLTTWFRDYLFLPLSVAVSRGIKKEKVGFIKADLIIYILASAVTWFLTGLWHGANYTFIVWGMIHGFFLILYQWQKQPRKQLFKKMGIKNSNSFVVFFETILTLFIVLLAWVFFRSDSISQSFAYLHRLFSPSLFELPSGLFKTGLIWGAVFMVAEWIQRDKQHALQFEKLPVYVRWLAYYAILFLIFNKGGQQETFIYFQF